MVCRAALNGDAAELLHGRVTFVCDSSEQVHARATARYSMHITIRLGMQPLRTLHQDL